MSFLAPLAGPAIGGLVGGLFGGGSKSSPQINYTPPGFNAGGLSATFGGNNYNVSPSGSRTATVGGLASTFGQQASDIGGLRSQVAPGYSALRDAQLSALNSSRKSAIGNLAQNLARRRVLGSSFGQDAIARANSQYNQDQAKIIADTYLKELAASQGLIQQQYAASAKQFQTQLNEMNLEAGLAADMTSKASATLAKLADSQASLDAKAAAGAGSFWGGLGTQFGNGIGKMLGSSSLGSSFGSLFGSAGSTASMGSIGGMASSLGAIF